MATQTPSAIRPLGPMEMYSSSRHHLGIYLAVAVSARHTPSTTLPSPSSSSSSLSRRFLSALAAVVSAHPMLRVGIADEHTNRARFTHLPAIDLRAHVAVEPVSCASEAELNLAVARIQAAQHNRRWETPDVRAPWRVTIVRGEGAARDCEDVVFAYHHALMDGTSGRVFHEHLLAALNAVALLDDDEEDVVEGEYVLSFPEPPVLPAPQEEAVPFTLGPLFIASILWGEFAPAILKPAPRKIWGGEAISFSRPYITRLLPVDLSADKTSALVAACRAHGTTLTALIHALAFAYFATALPEEQQQQQQGAGARGFSSCTPISMRKYTRDDGDDANALRVLVCTTDHAFSPSNVSAMRAASASREDDAAAAAEFDRLIWQTASRIRAEIAARSKTITHNNVAAMLVHVGDWTAFHTARDGKARVNSWECSNVGVLQRPAACEKDSGAAAAGRRRRRVEASRVMFSGGAMVTGAAVGINVASAPDGHLTAALTWQEGVVGEDLARGLGKSMEDMVTRFCETKMWTSS